MKRLLLFAIFFCLATAGRAQALDLPLIGLFCQGNCSYAGSWTYNDPTDITTSTVVATATGNLAGNSGDISGSLFTQCGGGCNYSLTNDCSGLIYGFTFANLCGCPTHPPVPGGDIFHFCFQSGGTTCQETFNGGWNASSTTAGAYINISMQSDLAVQSVSGCPANRPDLLTLDLASTPRSDCDGAQGPNGLPIPPFICNENFSVAPQSEENGNPVTGYLNIQGDAE